MSFTRLKTSKTTPSRVQVLLEGQIEMQFRDIHTMLRLPMPTQEHQLWAGCNFAAANSLFALVSGLSALEENNLDTKGISGKKFIDTMKRYYPWDLQPTESDTTPHGISGTIKHLYGYFRNPLAHSLGIKSDGNYLIVVEKEPLLESEIEQLEQIGSSPGAAIKYSPMTAHNQPIEMIVLDIPNFYWGVREMLYRMTMDVTLMAKVENNLTQLGL